MISYGACPRCKGPVIDFAKPREDSPLCIICGWRRLEVPPEIQAEVETYRGKDSIQTRYIRKRIGTGKPPLSGWEKEKRRRERLKDYEHKGKVEERGSRAAKS